MARATPQEQTGSIGVNEAMAAFERIGWGYAEVTRHDNGVDCFLMARDARLYDLGLTVGAQIKAGDSYFSRPKKRRGRIVGWWFRDADGEHLRDLVDHGLPQLLVLHDVQSRVTYWVEVTSTAVEITGKGSRILVPESQVVNEHHRAELNRIAARPQHTREWEGSAWTGASDLPQRDVLRTAILAPRLVALHANAGSARPISATQAIALLMQARLADLAHFAERHSSVPTIETAGDVDDWDWAFFHKLGTRLTSGDITNLRDAAATAPTTERSVAATVVYAGALIESDLPDDAVAILEDALKRDDGRGPDHAWLAVQLARGLGEIGRLDEARKLAASVQGLRYEHPADATAASIEGVGMQVLFRLSSLWDGDVSLAVRGRDTAVSWWRQQTRAWGLGAFLNHAFEHWARDRRVKWTGTDGAHDMLVSAGLMATAAGDHDDWRYVTEALGRASLARLSIDRGDQSAHAGLHLLRLAGDNEGLDMALEHLLLEGSALDVRSLASDLDLSRSTRTTARSAFTILQKAGPVLDEETAGRSAQWLLNLLAGDQEFVRRSDYDPPRHQVLDALGPVLRAATEETHRLVMNYFLEHGDVTDHLEGDRWANVLHQIDLDAWTSDDSRRAGEIALSERESEALTYACLHIAATHDPAVRDDLERRVGEGSISALATFGSVDELSEHAAGLFIQHATTVIESQIEQAHSNMWGYGGPDWLDAVRILSTYHPGRSNWRIVLQALEDPAVRSASKTQTLSRLAATVELIPEDIKERLREWLGRGPDVITEGAITKFFHSAAPDNSYEGAREMLGLALAEPGTEVRYRLQSLLAGSSEDHIWLARLAVKRRQDEDFGVLAVLSRDVNARVRAEVGVGIIKLMSAGINSHIATEALDHLSNDAGLLVPASMAGALADTIPGQSEALDALAEKFRSHPLRPVTRRLARRSAGRD